MDNKRLEEIKEIVAKKLARMKEINADLGAHSECMKEHIKDSDDLMAEGNGLKKEVSDLQEELQKFVDDPDSETDKGEDSESDSYKLS